VYSVSGNQRPETAFGKCVCEFVYGSVSVTTGYMVYAIRIYLN